MSNNNKASEPNEKQEWTLPVMDSARTEDSEAECGFDPARSEAWTSFAIGAVTKKVQQERVELDSTTESS